MATLTSCAIWIKVSLIIRGATDNRYYSTTREGGAESLQGLQQTAGLPKYLKIFGPGFFVVPARESPGE